MSAINSCIMISRLRLTGGLHNLGLASASREPRQRTIAPLPEIQCREKIQSQYILFMS